MAHTPLKIAIPQVQDEVTYAWANSYSPATIEGAIESIADEPAAYKISHLMSRLFFRGIYFPHKGAWSWLKLAFQNRGAIYRVVSDSLNRWHGAKSPESARDFNGSLQPSLIESAQPDTGGD
jgi:hypothetical protein